MNAIRILTPFLISGVIAFSYGSIEDCERRLSEDPSRVFEECKEELQPWTSSDGLPTSLKDIGLENEISLVETGSFGDGGSIFRIIKDENHHYFSFRKEQPQYADSEYIPWEKRKYTVGTVHPYYYKGGIEVPLGSDCEKFLEAIVKEHSHWRSEQGSADN